MTHYDDVSAIAQRHRNGAVAIGNFDGVHRGHQQLLRTAASAARGSAWGVVTFEPHPRDVFTPDDPVFRLTPEPVKTMLFDSLGANFTTTLTFNRDLAGLEPEQFVERVLVERLAVSHVVMGYDFHFGRGRKGSPHTMKALGEAHGFGVSIVDQVTDDAGMAPYSSSSIRQALRHGKLADAAGQLGYWWTLIGEVVNGDKRGRTIGFPTANIVLPPGCEPAEGIYALRVRCLGANPAKVWHAAGYIGKRPTFQTDRLFLEIFLFDFSGDLYGKKLVVEFIEFIRPDRKFDGVAALVEQMNADCERAAAVLQQAEGQAAIMSFPDRAADAGGR